MIGAASPMLPADPVKEYPVKIPTLLLAALPCWKAILFTFLSAD
jgi:hypothetical protein